MGAPSTQTGIEQLINQVDFLILQHLNYLNRLEDACRTNQPFPHKQPTECNFGKLFYAEVWSSKDRYPENIRQTLAEIENEHRTFHATAATIDSTKASKDDIDATSACKLILKLYYLEKLVKE